MSNQKSEYCNILFLLSNIGKFDDFKVIFQVVLKTPKKGCKKETMIIHEIFHNNKQKNPMMFYHFFY